MANNINSVNCEEIKQWLVNQQNKNKQIGILLNEGRKLINEDETGPLSNRIILDIRTVICAKTNCELNKNRSHRRITTYNMRKMELLHSGLDQNFEKIVHQLSDLWKQEKCNNYATIEKQKPSNIIKLEPISFVKESNSIKESKNNLCPIETVFTMIDEIAEENSIKTLTSKVRNAPGKKLTQLNSYRMSYGDINYLGNNKALFYFDRGIRGFQTYTNSMYSIKMQPPHKDIVVIDEIVFTSNCKCDSSNQHKEMFPHYRVTIAAGLTCPARLSTMERIIFARNKNASNQNFVTARMMLVRYW